MTAKPPKERTRREFVRCVGRGAALGALAALTGYLAARPRPDDTDVPCASIRTCRDCGWFNDCALPRADRARRGTRSRSS
jgi:hypothetical protein